VEPKGIEFDFEGAFASCAADLGCGNTPKTAIVVKHTFSDIDSDIAIVFQTGNAAWTPHFRTFSLRQARSTDPNAGLFARIYSANEAGGP
jgi:hypothetical protein